jgi:nucleotide-binding universal stress UspA family protein
MWETTPRKVLCAIETAQCRAALEYAGRAARQRHAGVHLVHVEPPAYGGSSFQGESQWLGGRILADAGRLLEQLLADAALPVTTELARGPVVETLVADSAYACLVVLQHRGMQSADGSPIFSVQEVVAGAGAPIVAVPADWRPATSPETPVVTVGVADRTSSARVVLEALHVAGLAGARLRLVHGRASLPRLGRLNLVAEFGAVLAECPEVAVEQVVVAGSATTALLRQAKDSEMLVVGRRRPLLGTPHPDPFDHALLRLSPVPVMVVDQVEAVSLIG